ncbi:MAG: hypothetical protein JNK93_04310 [Planctomycetia bacterium]|nr:hypothetical protein [Planctomycetia bacterium]
MNDERYRIVNLPLASSQLRAILDAAAVRGRLQEVVEAGEWMHSELERNPMEFGESRDFKIASQLYIRVGFVASLFVLFGVHETRKVVFVLKMGWKG